jgi:hypothetical protein
MPDDLETPGIGGESSSGTPGPLETPVSETPDQTTSSDQIADKGETAGAAEGTVTESVETLKQRIGTLERMVEASHDVIENRTNAFDRMMSQIQSQESRLTESISADEQYLEAVQNDQDAWQQIVNTPRLFMQWQARRDGLAAKKTELAGVDQRRAEYCAEAGNVMHEYAKKLGMTEAEWEEFLDTNGRAVDPVTGRITRNAFANVPAHRALRAGIDQLKGRYLKPLMAKAVVLAKQEAEAKVMRTQQRALPTGGGGIAAPTKTSTVETELLADLQRQIDAGEI